MNDFRSLANVTMQYASYYLVKNRFVSRKQCIVRETHSIFFHELHTSISADTNPKCFLKLCCLYKNASFTTHITFTSFQSTLKIHEKVPRTSTRKDRLERTRNNNAQKEGEDKLIPFEMSYQ